MCSNDCLRLSLKRPSVFCRSIFICFSSSVFSFSTSCISRSRTCRLCSSDCMLLFRSCMFVFRRSCTFFLFIIAFESSSFRPSLIILSVYSLSVYSIPTRLPFFEFLLTTVMLSAVTTFRRTLLG